MRLHLKNEKGFTLVELMAGIVILLLVMLGISPLLSSSVRVHSDITAKSSNIKDANTVVNNIAEELKYARSTQITFILPSGVQVTENSIVNGFTTEYTVPPNPALATNTNHGIYFSRFIVRPTWYIGTDGKKGDGVKTDIQYRRIRLLKNTVVMDYGPVGVTPNATTWEIVRSIDLSTGTDLVATAPLSGIPLHTGSIQSLTFSVINLLDPNVGSIYSKRKQFTITVVANANGFNSGSKDKVLNADPADPDRSATITTQVVNNNQ